MVLFGLRSTWYFLIQSMVFIKLLSSFVVHASILNVFYKHIKTTKEIWVLSEFSWKLSFTLTSLCRRRILNQTQLFFCFSKPLNTPTASTQLCMSAPLLWTHWTSCYPFFRWLAHPVAKQYAEFILQTMMSEWVTSFSRWKKILWKVVTPACFWETNRQLKHCYLMT